MKRWSSSSTDVDNINVSVRDDPSHTNCLQGCYLEPTIL